MRKGKKLGAGDVALIGMMAAFLEACKAALAFLPNIELVSFLIIMFTIFFRWKIWLVIPVFLLAEGCIYGMGLWWIQYLYVWPLLAGVSFVFRKQESVWFWSILSSAFGLLFGLLCAVPYGILGAADGGLRAGLHAGFAWWVAGIPFDLIHGVGNFAVMAVLYKPVRSVLGRAVKAWDFGS